MDAPAEDFVDWSLTAAEVVTKQWLREYVDPRLAELPAGRCHFVGGDFGRSGDLSVFWPVTEQADLTLATPFIVELRNCPYRTQQHILFHIIESLPRFPGWHSTPGATAPRWPSSPGRSTGRSRWKR